jgi:hypothetical protein
VSNPNPAQQPAPKKPRRWPWMVGVVVAFFVVAALSNGGDNKAKRRATPPAVQRRRRCRTANRCARAMRLQG